MNLPESEKIGRLNGITFTASWIVSDQALGTAMPIVGVHWKKPTQPDKFSTIADQLIAEFLESDTEDGQLDPKEDGDSIIGELNILGEHGDLTLVYTEAARLKQHGKIIQQFMRSMTETTTVGAMISYAVEVPPFFLFATSGDENLSSSSEILVRVDKLEQIIRLPTAISWISSHHPDIKADDFRKLLSEIARKAKDYFNRTEGLIKTD
jgi:hypothetical protein